jgi:hypothetical protein
MSQPIPPWMRLARLDPVEFRKRLLIDTGSGMRLLGEVMDPWQRQDFEALDPGWRRCVGQTTDDVTLRAYLERARGHSKTGDIATSATWALFSAKRRIQGVVAAGDLDQARLLRDGMAVLVRNNPWIGMALSVQNYRVLNKVTGSVCDVLASDAASNYGLTPDFLICDELTHWNKPEMWEAMFSSAAKRAACMVLVIANAGLGEGTSWQWRIREAARESVDWYFHRLDGPQASWIGEKLLREQAVMLPGSAYRRLWLNQWQRGTGDALEPADIEAACTIVNPSTRYDGWTHIQGLDLGIKHDHAALCVMACKPGAGRVKLASIQSWKPPDTGRKEVDLIEVKAAVRAAFIQYGSTVTFYDPHQCELMAQELRAEGFRMEPMTFVGQNLTRMASTLIQVFSGHKIDLFRDKQLVDDLLRLSIVERPYGYRLDAVSDDRGHADRATALAIALPTAAEISELPIQFNDGLGARLPINVA